MDNIDDEFFDETDGDFDEGAHVEREPIQNAVAELYEYIAQATWDNYDSRYFQDLIHDARDEIKDRNFSFEDQGEGLLTVERRIFVNLFTTIPVWLSISGGVLTLMVAWFVVYGGWNSSAGADMSAFMVSLTEPTITADNVLSKALVMSGLSGVIAVTMMASGWVIRRIYWWWNYDHDKKGQIRLRDTRDYNVHVIEKTIVELGGVVAERAVNEEPSKGASGLIQSNLTFMAEYNIRRTIKRCRTLFNIKIDRVDLPDVADHRGNRSSALMFAVLGTIVAALLGSGGQLSENAFVAAAPFFAFLMMPAAVTYLVHLQATQAATNGNCLMEQRRALLNEAYDAQPSSEFLRAAEYREDERDRVDFSDDVSLHRVHTHAGWLHEALGRYEKLKNRRLVD